MNSTKAQNALEYLLTYSWALIIITLAIAAFIAYGLFTPSHFEGNECVLPVGLSCTGSTLSTGGTALLNIKNTMQDPITITAIGCNSNQTIANMQAFSTTLEPNSNSTFYFSCYTGASPFSGLLGSVFTGSIVVNYTDTYTNAPNTVYGKLIIAATQVTAAGGGVSHYVPITLSNSQGSATASTFQQLIDIDSTTYAAYINGAWSNVEFTTGPGGTGSVLDAWIENNATNTVSVTPVWLVLSSSIPANSNAIVYMNFMNSNVLSASGPTGEAPQLSSTYAQYDDGSSVFTSYWNFAGSSLPSGWVGAGNYIVNNHLTVDYHSGTSYAYVSAAASPNSGTILDMYANAINVRTSNPLYDGMGYVESSLSQAVGFVGSSSNLADFIGSGTIGSDALSPSTYRIYSVYWPSSSSGTFYYGYAHSETKTGTITLTLHMGMAVYSTGTSATYNAYWFRTRVYPPSGVMPSASFGTVV